MSTASQTTQSKPTAPEKKPQMSMVKKFSVVLGIVLGIIVAFLPPPEGLDVVAMRSLGVFSCLVVYMIFNTLADWVIALLMAGGFVLIKSLTFSTAFGAFADTNVWMMLAAMGMGAGAAKSGLLQRASLSIMRFFPKTYKGQIASFLAAGTVIAPFIPSTAAKIAVVAPFGRAISDQLGYPAKSKGAAGIFSAMHVGFINTGALFLTASWLCYTIIGLFPETYEGEVTWISWFMGSWPSLVVLLIGCYLIFPRIFRPDHTEERPSTYIEDKLKEMGPMKVSEKISLFVLIACLAFWMTERIHGISATLIAVFAFAVLGLTNVIDRNDVKGGSIPWDSVLFMGGLLSVPTAFSALGINAWLSSLFAPFLSPLLRNPYLFVFVSMIFFYVLRLVLVSQVATISIFSVLLMPLMIDLGYHPWIIGFMLIIAVNTWTVKYQSAPFLIALYGTNEMVDHPQVIKSSLVFCGLSVLGLLVSIPVWQLLGMCP